MIAGAKGTILGNEHGPWEFGKTCDGDSTGSARASNVSNRYMHPFACACRLGRPEREPERQH
jgi:hypothetical protein